MQDLLIATRDNIKKIREYVECDIIPEDKCELSIFRHDSGLICDLIDDLDLAISSLNN